jgi:hypothetical protein
MQYDLVDFKIVIIAMQRASMGVGQNGSSERESGLGVN